MIIIYFRLTYTIGRYQRRPSQIHRPLKSTLVVLVPLAAFIHLSPARRITRLTVDVQTLNMLTYAPSRAASGSAAFSAAAAQAGAECRPHPPEGAGEPPVPDPSCISCGFELRCSHDDYNQEQANEQARKGLCAECFPPLPKRQLDLARRESQVERGHQACSQ
jgi:hypothetical protein